MQRITKPKFNRFDLNRKYPIAPIPKVEKIMKSSLMEDVNKLAKKDNKVYKFNNVGLLQLVDY